MLLGALGCKIANRFVKIDENANCFVKIDENANRLVKICLKQTFSLKLGLAEKPQGTLS